MTEYAAYKASLCSLKNLLGLGCLHILENDELMPYTSKIITHIADVLITEGKTELFDNVGILLKLYDEGIEDIIEAGKEPEEEISTLSDEEELGPEENPEETTEEENPTEGEGETGEENPEGPTEEGEPTDETTDPEDGGETEEPGEGTDEGEETPEPSEGETDETDPTEPSEEIPGEDEGEEEPDEPAEEEPGEEEPKAKLEDMLLEYGFDPATTDLEYFILAWTNIMTTLYMQEYYNNNFLFTSDPIDCHECCGSISTDESGNTVYSTSNNNVLKTYGCNCRG